MVSTQIVVGLHMQLHGAQSYRVFSGAYSADTTHNLARCHTQHTCLGTALRAALQRTAEKLYLAGHLCAPKPHEFVAYVKPVCRPYAQDTQVQIVRAHWSIQQTRQWAKNV